MTIPSTSDETQYRVSFFFGPEVGREAPHHLRCVFNVKKRSWKGGVQIAIDLPQDRLLRARQRTSYADWLGRLLERVDLGDREAVTCRADDLFIQVLCSCVLNLALYAGLEQENQVINAESFGADLDRLIEEQPEQLRERIRLELDLEDSPNPCLPRDPEDGKSEGV